MTGTFLPPQYQFAFGLIVYDSVVFVADALETRSLKYLPCWFSLKAPWSASVAPMFPAHSSLQQLRLVLKPSMSCSAPNTTTFAALRPAVVLGTCAHACANGAAAGVPSDTRAALVFAVADDATTKRAAAAPASSKRRLCINSPFST